MKKSLKNRILSLPLVVRIYFFCIKIAAKISPSRGVLYDLVYIVANRGWTFEGTCKDIDKHLSLQTRFHYGIKKVPPAKAYYFSHFNSFISAVARNPSILHAKNIVQYTHYSKPEGFSDIDITYVLNMASVILTMNTATEKMLVANGVRANKVHTLYIGVDETVFYPQKNDKERPTIGFNLRYEARESYSNRKRYDLIIDLIKSIDFCDVILLGRNWDNYDRFVEIKNLPYFQYVETSYREYPKYYKEMDVFVSVSILEGGPIPLLEAMFSNVFPVVSNTGFAPDLIKNEDNGILFDTMATCSEVIVNIKKGLRLSREAQVAHTVNHLTWKRFASCINNFLE